MRRLFCALLIALGPMLGLAGVGAVTAVPAAAAAPAVQPDDVQECYDQVSPEETMEKGPPSCRLENGRWVPYWETAASGSGFLAGFIVFALIWSAIPIFACYTIAKNNGQSTGVAMLLGLFLGWLGLLVVYLMGRSDTRAGAHNVVDALGPQRPFAAPATVPGSPPRPSPWPTPTPTPTPTPATDATEQRLRTLDRLRDSGTITSEEYAAKRQAILDEV